MLTKGPLADALQRGRQSFNARFAAASRSETPIDIAAFQEHVETVLEPIVRNVAREFAERADTVVDALFDLSLELFRNGLLGPTARYAIIPEAWRELLPRIPRLVAREPARVAGSITNALYHLTRTPGARPQAWLKACSGADFAVSVSEFLDYGAILAWRCGMPQYRQSALGKVSSLPPILAARALGVEQDRVGEALRRLGESPWATPQAPGGQTAKEMKLVGKAGAFRGFGGQFLTPPKVQSIGGEVIASDNQTAWRLCADAYNALLLRCEIPALAPRPGDAGITPDGTLRWKGQERRFGELEGATSIATNEDTVAVTLATSHHVFLIGWI